MGVRTSITIRAWSNVHSIQSGTDSTSRTDNKRNGQREHHTYSNTDNDKQRNR